MYRTQLINVISKQCYLSSWTNPSIEY
uniref:Uncharacterized protein n=1 Tax=Arundo donax TaxID=35708 RepID=A0A0A9CGW3_ARUDO